MEWWANRLKLKKAMEAANKSQLFVPLKDKKTDLKKLKKLVKGEKWTR